MISTIYYIDANWTIDGATTTDELDGALEYSRANTDNDPDF